MSYAVDGHETYLSLPTLHEAEASARALCQATGNGYNLVEKCFPRHRIVAAVRMDAAGRIWTDITVIEGTLL